MSSGTYTEPLNYATNFNVPLLIHIVVCSSGLNNEIMMINGKFTNGGQIPAHGNEKTKEQLVSELSQKITQEQDTLLSRGLRKSLEDLDYTHKNIRMERILNTLFEKLDYINIDELEDFIEKL